MGVAHTSPASAATVARRSAHRFQLAVALFMAALVLVGFWPSYFGPLSRGLASRHWILNLHGAVFTGWMVLLIAQVALAASGRVAAHRRLGSFGIGYGCAVVATGLLVSVAAPLQHVAAGAWDIDRAAGFLIVPLGDMMLFSGFFAAAIIYRRRPDAHKRLIILATTALLFAAVGRMAFLPLPAVFAVWLSPVLIGMASDAVTRGRIHPAYRVGLLVLAVGALRLPLETSPAWIPIGRSILHAFQ